VDPVARTWAREGWNASYELSAHSIPSVRIFTEVYLRASVGISIKFKKRKFTEFQIALLGRVREKIEEKIIPPCDFPLSIILPLTLIFLPILPSIN
jgi:hypothetical protein